MSQRDLSPIDRALIKPGMTVRCLDNAHYGSDQRTFDTTVEHIVDVEGKKIVLFWAKAFKGPFNAWIGIPVENITHVLVPVAKPEPHPTETPDAP